MRTFTLTTILLALLAAEPVCAQEIATMPIPTPPATPPQTTRPSFLSAGTQIRFVLLDSVSSETAPKGRKVRFVVAQDVEVNGRLVIPRGTPAEGVVKHVRKGIPDKHNGELQLEPKRILLPYGKNLKLIRTGEDCDNSIPGCWVLVPFLAAGIAVFGPIELGAAAVNAIRPSHHRNVLTQIHPKIEGTDVTREPCDTDTAVLVHQWKIPAPNGQEGDPISKAILKTLDACAAHGKG